MMPSAESELRKSQLVAIMVAIAVLVSPAVIPAAGDIRADILGAEVGTQEAGAGPREDGRTRGRTSQAIPKCSR